MKLRVGLLVMFMGLRSAVSQVDRQPQVDPAQESETSSDPLSMRDREAKNSRYSGQGPDLTNLAPEEHVIHHVWPRTEFIPVSQSAVVAVVSVARMQPHLSSDHSSIYTEITLNVENILKGSDPRTNRLVIDLAGGSLALQSGQIVRDETSIDFLGKPRVGGRYILFAKGMHAGKDLVLLKGYELRDGSVFLMTKTGNPSDLKFARIPNKHDPLSEEGAFLVEVRRLVGRAN